MILSNFLFRVRQYLHDNRARVFKAVGVICTIGALFLTIVSIVEKVQRAKYEKRVRALEEQFQKADADAKEAQARADAKQKEIDAKQSELQFLEARADAAEKALRTTRQVVIPLKEHYEEIRNSPMPTTPVSCADICSELAGLGYPCR